MKKQRHCVFRLDRPEARPPDFTSSKHSGRSLRKAAPGSRLLANGHEPISRGRRSRLLAYRARTSHPGPGPRQAWPLVGRERCAESLSGDAVSLGKGSGGGSRGRLSGFAGGLAVSLPLSTSHPAGQCGQPRSPGLQVTESMNQVPRGSETRSPKNTFHIFEFPISKKNDCEIVFLCC